MRSSGNTIPAFASVDELSKGLSASAAGKVQSWLGDEFRNSWASLGLAEWMRLAIRTGVHGRHWHLNWNRGLRAFLDRHHICVVHRERRTLAMGSTEWLWGSRLLGRDIHLGRRRGSSGWSSVIVVLHFWIRLLDVLWLWLLLLLWSKIVVVLTSHRVVNRTITGILQSHCILQALGVLHVAVHSWADWWSREV